MFCRYTKCTSEGVYCLGAKGMEPGPRYVREGHPVAQIAGGMAVLAAIVDTAALPEFMNKAN